MYLVLSNTLTEYYIYLFRVCFFIKLINKGINIQEKVKSC